MAVTAMAGTVGWAPQESISTLGGYTAPTLWYRHKATLVDLGVLDDVRLGAPEVGGVPVPTFPYKAGVLVGGGLTIQPRLEDTIGWLLYGMLGKNTSTVVGATTVYNHVMIFNTDPSDVKWFSFRKHIPRKNNVATSDLGEQFTDCKIVGMTMNLPNDAPITMRMDVLGRTFNFDADPTAWSWVNTFESFASIPIGCKTSGFLKIGGTELPIVGATVTFQNVPLDIRQERVFGDPYIDDITIIMRQLSFDVAVKWSDPQLYSSIVTGSTTGTQWSSTPYTASLDILIESPGLIPAETVPYSLRIQAPAVMMAQSEGVTLAGNQAIITRYSGTALESTGSEYVTFTLTNDTASYTWPT